MIYCQKASFAEQLRFERCFIQQFPDGLTNEHIFKALNSENLFLKRRAYSQGKFPWLLLGSEDIQNFLYPSGLRMIPWPKAWENFMLFFFSEKWWGASAQAWAYHVMTHAQRLETPLLQEIWLTRLEDRIIGHDPFALYG